MILDDDPGVRGVVAHGLERLGDQAKSFEEDLFKDRIATFNLLALQSELRRDPEAAQARLPGLVYHRSTAIRYIARHRLTESQGLNNSRSYFADLYCNELRETSEKALASIAGLAEVGDKSDLGLVLEASRTAMATEDPAHVMKMIRKLPYWVGVEALLTVWLDANPSLRELICGELSEVVRVGARQLPPKAEQARRLCAALT